MNLLETIIYLIVLGILVTLGINGVNGFIEGITSMNNTNKIEEFITTEEIYEKSNNQNVIVIYDTEEEVFLSYLAPNYTVDEVNKTFKEGSDMDLSNPKKKLEIKNTEYISYYFTEYTVLGDESKKIIKLPGGVY